MLRKGRGAGEREFAKGGRGEREAEGVEGGVRERGEERGKRDGERGGRVRLTGPMGRVNLSGGIQ